MKEIAKGFILICAGFGLGFSAYAGVQIAQRKARNAVFVAEASAELGRIRTAVAGFKKAKGRWPAGPRELVAAGLLDPANAPYERLRGSANWVGSWDGQGGFFYDPGSGKATLNADLRRQKFTASDWDRIRREELVPLETLN